MRRQSNVKIPTMMSTSPSTTSTIRSTITVTSLHTVRTTHLPTVTTTHRMTFTRTQTSQQNHPRGSYHLRFLHFSFC